MKLITKPKYFLTGCALVLGLALPASLQQPQQQRIERMEGYLATPQKLEFTAIAIATKIGNREWGIHVILHRPIAKLLSLFNHIYFQHYI